LLRHRLPGILSRMNEVTRILSAVDQGETHAAEQLLPLVYEELRRLAAQKLRQERPGQSLQPTALVHEAYLRLVDTAHQERWDSRGHFFAAAAEAMRRILVERARRKKRHKHGGGRHRVELADSDQAAPVSDVDLLALDEALTKLAQEDPLAARVVELRYFAGLPLEQVRLALGLTAYAVRQKWNYARAWLQVALGETAGGFSNS
jgi:RNA polymerase sigma factor (TIGR02999 family)